MRAALIVTILLFSLSYGMTSSSAHRSLTTPQTLTITLYAKNKYQTDPRANCFNLEAGSLVTADRRCDLLYGTIYVGDDFDWFQSWAAAGNRSVIKDLGPQLWTDTFTVPVIEPLPKLKPGEQRRVVIDASGADGADGAPGAPGAPALKGADGAPGRPGGRGDLVRNGADGAPGATARTSADADEVVRTVSPPVVVPPARPKHDGIPKIDPLFAKAIVGHMYAIHVVDPSSDFYALFRVEAIERGDKCTISWRLIPAPEEQIEKATRK